jgi:hypothetical protein
MAYCPESTMMVNRIATIGLPVAMALAAHGDRPDPSWGRSRGFGVSDTQKRGRGRIERGPRPP